MSKLNRRDLNNIDKQIAKELKSSRVSDEHDSDNVVKRFVILFIIIVLLVVGIYFLTTLIVDKRNDTKGNDTIAGEVNYDVVSVGMILNRPYEEYYVMVYNSEDSEAVYYSSLITNYQQKEKSLKLYFCDLGSVFNQSYVSNDGNSNSKAQNIDELKFGKVTLLKIKDGKISKYIETVDDIKATLQ